MMTPVHYLLSGAVGVAALIASSHAVIYKREPRSAALWVIVIWLIPAFGPILYLLLGINRVRRRAVVLRGDLVRHRPMSNVTPYEAVLDKAFSLPETEHLRPLAQMVGRVTARPLLPGNAIEPLVDGTQAYPAMLAAIESASSTIALAVYIFDGSGIGDRFLEALTRAHKRGVEVRVLLDAVGAKYSWPSAQRGLRQQGIRVAHFNPRTILWWLPAMNLRNHRKILVVDGQVGFTGGMNIKREFWQPKSTATLFHDLHFCLRGPAVAQLSEVFATDWQFATGESLHGTAWFPTLSSAGDGLARGIEAGPDESYERLRWVIIGALNAARRSVRILTPYFLPDAAIVSALNAAALRGVEVSILLPEHSNLFYVQWATFAHLWQVLDQGCRVWLSPGSFDHSKLMLVDGVWTFFGSANWDTRSLRLNFELNVECYSTQLGARMEQLVQRRLAEARPITLAQVDARPILIKLRDGIARLFAPYL